MSNADLPCPCGSGAPYARCCEPLHLGAGASTAETLMRSRYSAFALRLTEYLSRTWHPSTRPGTLELDHGTVWRRLQIVDTVGGGPDDSSGVVEFRASYRSPDGAGVLHERSRFARNAGHWAYVDGDSLD
jgi:SEC-C motif-containing protein